MYNFNYVHIICKYVYASIKALQEKTDTLSVLQ